MSQRKVLFLCGGGYLPHPQGNGNAVLTFGIVSVLLELGFEVHVVPVSLRCNGDKFRQDQIFLEKLAVKVKVLKIDGVLRPVSNSLLRIRTWVRALPFGKDLGYFYSKSDVDELITKIKESDYEYVYGYDWDTVSIFAFIKDCKARKVISLVDLMDVFFESRRRKILANFGTQSVIPALSFFLGRRKPYLGYQFLRYCDFVIEHAAQHAAQLNAKGFQRVHYIPHPIKSKPILMKDDAETIVISIIGSLKGTSSQLGFNFFLDKLYPCLREKRSLLSRPVEFRIVGYGVLPAAILERLRKIEEVKIVGFVDEIHDEFNKADIVLVTIPVSQGFRTRIAEAFSYGKCVVAHDANIKGMPEAIPNHNIVVSDAPEILVDNLIRLVGSKGDRDRLGENAHKTFVDHLSIESAIPKYALLFE